MMLFMIILCGIFCVMPIVVIGMLVQEFIEMKKIKEMYLEEVEFNKVR